MSSNSKPTPNNQSTQLNSTLAHPQFATAYGPKLRVALTFPEQGREKQSFKEECDINNIMRRFSVTGVLDHVNQRQPMWGEVPDLDFAGAMAIVVDARERFEQLPALVRDRFNNDPAKLLEFIRDPANRDEGVKLGLFRPKEAPAAPPPVSPTGTPSATPPSAS